MQNSSVLPVRHFLWLAILTGLLTGYLEVLLLGIQKFVFGEAIFFGPHIIWMAPLADGLWFCLLGILFVLLSKRWLFLRAMNIAVSLFLFLTLLSGLFIFNRIKWYAAVLLGAGAAVQLGRVLTRYFAKWQAALARTVSYALIVLALTICSVNGWLWWQEHHALASLPPSPNAAPNVLLITLDTVRAQSLSLYGYQRKTTPQLERLAQQGVKFDRAFATAPWTLPSHASMFTGHYPHELSTDFLKPLNDAKTTLAESLSRHGYLTAGFVANTYYCGYEHGLARGFLHYEDYTVSWEELALSASLLRALLHNARLRQWLGYQQVLTRKSAADINQEFLAWLNHSPQPEQRPFFAFLNYFDAHEPYLPPAPYDAAFTSAPCKTDWPYVHTLRTAWIEKRERMSAAQHQAALDAYDSSIAYLDQQLGKLFDELQRQGRLKNTLVIITSDHGEAFGEHGHHGHSDNLYLPLLQVPLMISFPARIPMPQTVSSPVSLRDLPATVMDLLNLGSASPFPGRSWMDVLETPHSNVQPIMAEVNLAPIQPDRYKPGTKAKLKSVIYDRYQYIKNPDGSEEVYDLATDPHQLFKLSGDEKGNRIIEIKRSLLPQERDALVSD